MKKTMLIISLAVASFLLWFSFYLTVPLEDATTTPSDKIIAISESPNKKYKIYFYLIEPTQMLVAPTIQGVLIKGDIRKNIFLQEADSVKVKWLDETNVIINDHKLNVLSDVYDGV